MVGKYHFYFILWYPREIFPTSRPIFGYQCALSHYMTVLVRMSVLKTNKQIFLLVAIESDVNVAKKKSINTVNTCLSLAKVSVEGN